MADYNLNTFSPAALKRWQRIPEWAQNKILDNVFCSQCPTPVTIILETAEMRQKSLILRGRCANCGKEICRVVEPKDE